MINYMETATTPNTEPRTKKNNLPEALTAAIATNILIAEEVPSLDRNKTNFAASWEAEEAAGKITSNQTFFATGAESEESVLINYNPNAVGDHQDVPRIFSRPTEVLAPGSIPISDLSNLFALKPGLQRITLKDLAVVESVFGGKFSNSIKTYKTREDVVIPQGNVEDYDASTALELLQKCQTLEDLSQISGGVSHAKVLEAIAKRRTQLLERDKNDKANGVKKNAEIEIGALVKARAFN